jgi:predicted dehydrogenase
MAQPRPLRAAIVGAGMMGRRHAEAAQRAGARISLVTDSDSSKAGALARQLGAKSTDVASDALSRDVADVVHVCTPLENHEGVVRAALGAGLHAMVEKPLASSAAITAELYALAATNSVHLCPTHQFLFQPGVMGLLDNRQTLGKLRDLSIATCTAGADEKDDAARDRVAFNILPHPLSLASRILPDGLANAHWRSVRTAPGEIHALGMSGETTISILISTHGRPTRNTLVLTGDRATWHADLFHGFGFEEEAAVSRASKMTRPFALAARTLAAASQNAAGRALAGETAFPGLRELVRRFYASVQSGEDSPVTINEALDVAAARDTIILSLAGDSTGRTG